MNKTAKEMFEELGYKVINEETLNDIYSIVFEDSSMQEDAIKKYVEELREENKQLKETLKEINKINNQAKKDLEEIDSNPLKDDIAFRSYLQTIISLIEIKLKELESGDSNLERLSVPAQVPLKLTTEMIQKEIEKQIINKQFEIGIDIGESKSSRKKHSI